MGLTLFIVASALAVTAPNIETLIAVRTLQGVGGAIMMPGTLAIITNGFPTSASALAHCSVGCWCRAAVGG
jgi:DHA2 family methylenomycin A resistance protein-like MFS transporter